MEKVMLELKDILGMVSHDLINYLTNMLVIALASASAGSLLVESIKDIKEKIFKKGKLKPIISWILNLIFNIGFVSLFIITFNKADSLLNLCLYISQVTIFSLIISTLLYKVIIKNFMLIVERFTSANRKNLLEEKLEIIEIHNKMKSDDKLLNALVNEKKLKEIPNNKVDGEI
jgi:magnesium-transporting ATPase (P-type)